MKYLKYFENSIDPSYKNSIDPVVNTLNNLINTLGLKFESSKSSGPIFSNGNYNDFYPVCELNLNVTTVKNSILSIIINSLLDTVNCDYKTIPIYENFPKNYLNDKEFRILINCTNNEASESTLVKKIYTKNNEELYVKILQSVINFFENTTKEYYINPVNGIFPKKLEKNIIDLNYINMLIINYLKLLTTRRYSKNTNYNFKDLYKFTYNAISEAPESYKMFYNIYINNNKLYNQLKIFGDTKIETGKELGEIGF